MVSPASTYETDPTDTAYASLSELERKACHAALNATLETLLTIDSSLKALEAAKLAATRVITLGDTKIKELDLILKKIIDTAYLLYKRSTSKISGVPCVLEHTAPAPPPKVLPPT